MSVAPPGTPGRNPFVTRHTRPGSLRPRDRDGTPLDLETLVVRARCLPATAIEGPHGSGKTNLLAALAAYFAAAGLLAASIRVRSRRDGGAVLRAALASPSGTTLCVDGWEALGGAWAAVVRWVTGRRRVGLLVTCHHPARMPTLLRCGTTPDLLSRLVADLPDHGGIIGDRDIAEAFAARGGNVREALYDLYDRYERRTRRA